MIDTLPFKQSRVPGTIQLNINLHGNAKGETTIAATHTNNNCGCDHRTRLPIPSLDSAVPTNS
ncbi:hypothetical protein CY34DRAFT_809023 [Suillus luteus UH-Slu-Lm8-n1]|uniref:Uncharacterized protein n=1 Tax=Suillus luteus UH-Slu-Lm8-n1 TaxID=930992 RepID=A0A0D0B4D1_9AGAM|nr:hypothetical protein CY34DRAFT_809023 [Suillus luteus UH-Slu-Lm8-n1]